MATSSAQLTWNATASGQHYAELMREFLQDARRDFGDVPSLRVALDAYEADVGYLLHRRVTRGRVRIVSQQYFAALSSAR